MWWESSGHRGNRSRMWDWTFCRGETTNRATVYISSLTSAKQGHNVPQNVRQEHWWMYSGAARADLQCRKLSHKDSTLTLHANTVHTTLPLDHKSFKFIIHLLMDTLILQYINISCRHRGNIHMLVHEFSPAAEMSKTSAVKETLGCVGRDECKHFSVFMRLAPGADKTDHK